MIATPLADDSPRVVRDLLIAHGWDADRAATAGGAVRPVLLHLTELDDQTREVLSLHAGRLGFDLLSGEGWALLVGSRSRLAAFARPWSLPPELAQAAMVIAGALPAEPPDAWLTAGGPVALDGYHIVGVLNVTPDSFSDGGRYATVDAALEQAEHLLVGGAGLIDVGGESTRPGSQPVEATEERRRVEPVIRELARRHPGIPLSVDTVKAEVAAAALDAGAAIINDPSAFRLDQAMAGLAIRSGAGVVLMHSRGGVADMASLEHADYGADPVGAILRELRDRLERAVGAGVEADRIVLDPGLGFGKDAGQNLLLLDQLTAFRVLGRPLLVGPSRKRFLGAATGLPVGERDRATAVACAIAYREGVRLFRVHHAALAREALDLAQAIERGTAGAG